MRVRLALALAGAFIVFQAAPPAQAAPAKSPKPPHAGVCGTIPRPGTFAEPPDVDVSALPRDAGGNHELILSAHREGDRFCYTYRWNGVAETRQPTIHVHRGERFSLRLVNDLSGPARGEHVASTSIPPCMPMAMPNASAVTTVGYLNHPRRDLFMRMPPRDTNMHFHGFEGPASEENIFLSTLSTPMHACEYTLTIPRTQPPGTYFYHSHAHGASEDQVFGGLSGMWIVEPDAVQLARSNEHPIILRARLPVGDDNRFAPDDTPLEIALMQRQMRMKAGPPLAFDPFHPPALASIGPLRVGALSLDPTGCDGNFSAQMLSVNGANAPVRLDVPAGAPQLLRVLNATSDSIKLLRLRDQTGAAQPFKVVARDGIPLGNDDAAPLASYALTSALVSPPAGRADVLITVQPGNDLTLYTDHQCLGSIGEFALKHDLVTIHALAGGVSADPTITSAPIASNQTRAARLVAYARLHPQLIRRRALTYTFYIHPPHDRVPPAPIFYITDTTNRDFVEHPFWPVYKPGDMVPARADIIVKAGTLEEWTLYNATLESHTFHIHQMAFAAEESGGPVMLDTVFVPFGKMLTNKRDPNYPLIKPSATRILLDFRNVPRGTFVFHCHMLFHEDHGMMGVVRVE